MSQSPRVPPEEFVESMKDDLEQYAKEVMEAVNQAADGEWIAGSEERVRDLSAEMRQRVLSGRCRSESTRRKPLFPPPHHPTTGKRLANKGRQSHRVLTVNGEIKVVRRWWHGPQVGSVAPADEILDRNGTRITPGVWRWPLA